MWVTDDTNHVVLDGYLGSATHEPGKRAQRRSSWSRSGLPVASSGSASTISMRSGVLNGVTPCAANHARHASRSKSAGRDDERAHPLAHEPVGVADRDGLRHRGVALEHRLDLGRRDVLAAADDQVLDAAHDAEPTVVDGGEVAGAEPSVVDRRRGVVRVRDSRRTAPSLHLELT